MAPVSDARRKANEKWDKENMITLGCRLKRTQAQAFKEHAAEQGKTANTMLRDYVLDCIGEDERDKA
jgi:hypothetical protein